jgi:hypothetical protein
MGNNASKSSWATGGGVLLGLGAGFFFLPNALAFTGSLLIGLGVGLVITAVIDRNS